MSAPKVGVWKDRTTGCWWWECHHDSCASHTDSFDIERTLSAAADAGRAHLARFHTAQMPASTYCRTHGMHSAECGCGSGKSPTGDESGAYNAAQPFGDDFPCCTTPMQHAHTHSREDC